MKFWHDDEDDFLTRRHSIRQAVKDRADLAIARMAVIYDDKHKPVELKDWAYIKIVKGIGTGYSLPSSSKLSPVKQGPFRIKRKVGRLAYELDLPATWRIHPIISVIHLEQAYPDDVYHRTAPRIEDAAPVIVEGQEEHEIERIIRQSADRCLIKWKNGDETWEPVANLKEDVPDLLRRFQAKQRQKRAEAK
ncbi:retrotransposon polyprotein, putative [Aspergillus udagawae]|uniref:Retrotransposon polyprotein, putative n=1 Tax=Aspergillus udagawae TaxID=91492 RepID=A0A8H3NB42_9EURO|nr:retrotransposon polyprotein, putative [Aspergillus udagawae]